MEKLNLPEFEYKLHKTKGRLEIFDTIRKKFVVLTPEEWVRQHFVNFLVHHFKYPKSLIKLEGGLKYNTMRRRSDIVVYDRSAAPFMIVECKAASVAINQNVFNQAATYNKSLAAKYLVVTNGMVHYCCEINHHALSYRFLDELPTFE